MKDTNTMHAESTTLPTPLIFDTVDAIHSGGRYVLGADGRAVRDNSASGPLPADAEGAPGPTAELNAAVDGVALARPKALTVVKP